MAETPVSAAAILSLWVYNFTFLSFWEEWVVDGDVSVREKGKSG